MKCITDDLTQIYGNYDSYSAENLMVVFELCDPDKTTCKSEQKIKEWIKSKYIVTLTNQRDFISHEFKEKRIAEQSSIKWFAMSEISRVDQVRMITRSKLKLNDY